MTDLTDIWIPVAEKLPLNGEVVMTKIDDEDGCRNEQSLVWENNLWWPPDKSMYIYYCPTHWAAIGEAK